MSAPPRPPPTTKTATTTSNSKPKPWLLPTILSNTLLLIGIFTFAVGFFPYKPFLPGLNVFTPREEEIKAPFDRVVFMVVDALRSDFVYSNTSNFKYTQSLIRTSHAIPFTSHASAPTITMPRIKSMLTGSVPGFLDMILNFAESDTTSTLANQDNWPEQIRARGGKVVMYGDDTWIKLLPSTFERSEGTTSFFVSDFTEVDTNVTRHVPRELENSDWNAMILHYLGLDHVGHKAGPKSAFMPPKQHEMDTLIHTLYTTLHTTPHHANTLLILVGDHGMNDAGGHGGSTPGETSAVFLLLSPKFVSLNNANRRTYDAPAQAMGDGGFTFHRRVRQEDVAATVAALLHVPVGRNGVGNVVQEVLGLFDDQDRVHLLMHNANQLLQLVTSAYPSFTPQACPCPTNDSETIARLPDKAELECLYARVTATHTTWATAATTSKQGDDDDEQGTNEDAVNVEVQVESQAAAEEALQQFISRAQAILSQAASNYNLPLMGVGVLSTAIGALMSIYTLFFRLSEASSLAPTLKEINNAGTEGGAVSARNQLLQKVTLLGITTVYAIMMFASSYVEEEHNFWYWATTAWVTALVVREIRTPTTSKYTPLLPLIALILLRLSRRWNQTGQKHQGSSDVATTYLLKPAEPTPTYLWLLIFSTYGYILHLLISERSSLFHSYTTGTLNPLERLASSVLVSLAAVFKASFAQQDAAEMVPEWLVYVTEGAGRTVWGGWGDVVIQARFVFLGIVAFGAVALLFTPRERNSQKGRKLHALLLLLLATQSRFWNVPLLGLVSLQYELLRATTGDSGNGDQSSGDLVNAITTLLYTHTTFFLFGGSNNISSLDLSNALNGVAEYNVVLVGILGFLGNFAGPVFWVLAPQAKGENGRRWAIQTTFFTCAAATTMVACAVLRTHLFIWTVFSPKFLYVMMWSVLVHVGVGGIIGVGLGSLVG